MEREAALEAEMIDVVICYKSGTSKMLNLCLSSFFRHTPEKEVRVHVVMDIKDDVDILELLDEYPVVHRMYPVMKGPSVSSAHRQLLDAVFESVDSPLFLTMDSDCFPVSDGWLDLLKKNMGEGVLSGIAHPWPAPPEDLDEDTIEWRVLSQMWYQFPHVACTLAKREFIENNNLKFSHGDDTGFDIVKEAFERGVCGDTVMPTCCAMPDEPKGRDAELNRYVSIVFGDAIYHHGGASRQQSEGFAGLDEMFSRARGRVLEEGAEFLLMDGHRYSFAREEIVIKHRLSFLRRQMVAFLSTHERLFNEG